VAKKPLATCPRQISAEAGSERSGDSYGDVSAPFSPLCRRAISNRKLIRTRPTGSRYVPEKNLTMLPLTDR
jgi:hypothetical protein